MEVLLLLNMKVEEIVLLAADVLGFGFEVGLLFDVRESSFPVSLSRVSWTRQFVARVVVVVGGGLSGGVMLLHTWLVLD